MRPGALRTLKNWFYLKLNEAWRDQEVLERLKQKQKEEWQEQQRKFENQELDEIGQIRADRQRREKVS